MHSRLKQNDRDMLYRIYVTDSLKALLKSNKRYYDLVFGLSAQSDEEPDPEAIKARITSQASKYAYPYIRKGGADCHAAHFRTSPNISSDNSNSSQASASGP